MSMYHVKSSLHEHFSTAPTGITGYFGSDCALPICIQGLFDPICNASVVANDLNLTSGNITGIDVMASSIVSSGMVAIVARMEDCVSPRRLFLCGRLDWFRLFYSNLRVAQGRRSVSSLDSFHCGRTQSGNFSYRPVWN
ncbi:hypothetical protein GQ600_4103 [Phytophthora cactorum]|nr:hypothetical protein GQ600_4103 [Phytophthora cactorum]